jgi:hypothetical protein
MAKRRHTFILLLMAVFLWLAAPVEQSESAAPHNEAAAQSEALQLIAAVNAFRASQGLAPYGIDAGLMDYALGHAQYMASIQTATHTHSDGSTAWALGLEENIATGGTGFLTPDYAVYTIWQDPVHLRPMAGFVDGVAGAGVASDGKDTYYAFNVRPAGAPARPGTGLPATSADPGTPTPYIPTAPLVTATPRGDGTIWHEVGYGQTLWAIARAYGVEEDALCGLNSMEAGCTEIYAGVRLLIRWKGPTPTPGAAIPETAGDRTPAGTGTPAGAGAGPGGLPALPTTTTAAVALAPGSQTADGEAASTAGAGTVPADREAPPSGETAPRPGGEGRPVAPFAAGVLILAGGLLLAVMLVMLAAKRGG